MKKLILLTLWFLFIFMVAIASASEPKFKVHVLPNLAPGVNYSINYPIVIDYDNDGDQDVLIINKEGVIYLLENITNQKEE